MRRIGIVCLPAHRLGQDGVTLPYQQCQDAEKHASSSHICGAPVIQAADADHKEGRDCPAQIARQSMRAKGISQPGRRHPLVEDGEVHRMEGSIAYPK